MSETKFVVSCVSVILLTSTVRTLPTWIGIRNQLPIDNIINYNKNPKHVKNVQKDISDEIFPVNRTNGTGLFRDPLEVLGPAFHGPTVVGLCEIELRMFADAVTNIRFTIRGKKLCSEVCNHYHRNFMSSEPLDLQRVTPGYCDYVGDTFDMNDQSRLSTECVCTYKIRCNYRSVISTYTFQSDDKGYLKVCVKEPKTPLCITL